MSIEIIKQNDDLIPVNGKEIRKNMNGNWVQQEAFHLSTKEAQCCGEFLRALEVTRHKIQKATYTV